MGNDKPEDIDEAIKDTIDRAKKEGMSDAEIIEAEKLLVEFKDSFRIKLGPDPPENVEPYEVSLAEGAKPFRKTQRRYATHQRAFIGSTMRCLEKLGAVVKKHSAKWASPALAVPKPGTDNLRFTVDLRVVKNKQTRWLVRCRTCSPCTAQQPEAEYMHKWICATRTGNFHSGKSHRRS